MIKYVVIFRQGNGSNEYFAVKSLEDAHRLIEELEEEANAWNKPWEAKIAPAMDY